MSERQREGAARAARSALIALLLAITFSGAANAGEATPAAEDPAVESRVSALAAELRCLVCQNQSLADSNAPLAVDLRNEIRDKIRKGESEREIVGFMVERYGDFVRYRPPLNATTVLLWGAPLLLVAGGLLALYRRLRAPARPQSELSPADRDRARKLLADEPEDTRA